MKSTLLIISILTLAAFSVTTAQQASAQSSAKDPNSPRFIYAPNRWAQDKTNMPRAISAPEMVKQGEMRNSPGFLGVDTLEPTPKKVIPASAISHTIILPKTSTPSTTFKPGFGKPLQELPAGEPFKAQTSSKNNALPPRANTPTPTRKGTAENPPRHHPHEPARTVLVKGLMTSPAHKQPSAASPAADSYGPGGYESTLGTPPVSVEPKTNKEVRGEILQKENTPGKKP